MPPSINSICGRAFFCQPRRKGCGLEGDRSRKMRPPPPHLVHPTPLFLSKGKRTGGRCRWRGPLFLPFFYGPRGGLFSAALTCLYIAPYNTPGVLRMCTRSSCPSLKTPQQESFCSVARAPSPSPPLVFKKRRRNLHDANFFPAVKEDHVRTPPRLFPPPYPLSSRYRAGIFVFFLSLRRRWDHWASMRGRRIPHKTRARSTDKPPTSKQSFPLLSPSFLPPIQQ